MGMASIKYMYRLFLPIKLITDAFMGTLTIDEQYAINRQHKIGDPIVRTIFMGMYL